MKKFVFAAVCTMTLASFVVADEFSAIITKIDGKNITYYKTKAPEGGAKGGGKKGGGFGKAEKVGDAITAKVSDKVESCQECKGHGHRCFQRQAMTLKAA